MDLNETVSAQRLHIGFFGRRNVGKSSLVNAVTGQALALVSEVAGTTTDPVRKAMELLPLGPVVIVDTPGMDDEGALGEARVQRARQALDYTDVAVLVADAGAGLGPIEQALLRTFEARNTPYLIAYNKADLLERLPPAPEKGLYVSALRGTNIWELKEMLGCLQKKTGPERPIVSDLLRPGETALLVTPIDASAPKGRLILPQQQTLRDLLDGGHPAMVCRDSELAAALERLAVPPGIVITDSQAFGKVAKLVPPALRLTSFSILMARYKGSLPALVAGAAALDRLKDGDKVLVAEGCTHHRQCEDIGTVKLPRWLGEYTGKKLEFQFCAGREFPETLEDCALVLHCGGCMLNEKEMGSRVGRARAQGVPMTNYGVAIAQVHGLLRRSLEPFPDMLRLLDGGAAL